MNEEQERTKIKKEEFIKYLGDSKGIITAACAKAGVGRSTYYEWIDADEVFAKKCAETEREQRDYVHDQFLGKIVDGDNTCIIFYLKNKHPDYKQKLELSGNITTEKKYSTMSDEELIAALQETRKIKEGLENDNTYSTSQSSTIG